MTAVFFFLWLVTVILWLATRTRLIDERRFNDRLLRQIDAQRFGTHPTSRAVERPEPR